MKSTANTIRDQEQEHALRLTAMRLAHRLATDESLRDGTRPNNVTIRALLAEHQEQGASPDHDQGVVCRILVHVVYFLADLGMWDLVRVISEYAIENDCWGGV